MWAISVAAFAFILGVVSKSVSSAGISKNVQQEIAKLGSGSIVTPSGYLAFVFIFFILAVSLFACAQIGAARHEEADAAARDAARASRSAVAAGSPAGSCWQPAAPWRSRWWPGC